MNTLDDTTTLENSDLDEDKTQLLPGDKRLEYFGGNTESLLQGVPGRQSLLRRIFRLLG